MAGILSRQEGPVNEQALRDCVRIIQQEHQTSSVSGDDDLLRLRDKLKERKGVK